MQQIDPMETTRAYAWEMWMNAPMPMVTFFKTLDVTRVLRVSRRHGLKFNMLMCWCIGRAASQIREFFTLPVDGRLMKYDSLAVNTIVANGMGEVSSCDVPFSDNIVDFSADYDRFTRQVAESCENHDLTESMVIGTSALGVFNNPFMIWGRYKRGLFKTRLSVSFQFHHTQMDGAHAARFLDLLQKEISGLKINF